MTSCLSHDARVWPGPVTVDRRGRVRVWLGASALPRPGWRRVEGWRNRGRGWRLCRWVHPAATSGGWQWAPRFLVWEETGEILRPDEHAHHTCLNRWCCNPEHLAVSLAEFHGRYHALYTCLRDGKGRFREYDTPTPTPTPRFGPIIGRAALA